MDNVKRLMSAFEGFSDAHGQTRISAERRAGKQSANSYIKRSPLTAELVNGHLSGVLGVGSIPINEDNQCKFGALDIDIYPLDHIALDKQLRKLKIPCVVCRSKSGGAHIFFFMTEWMSAGEFRDKASEIASVIGHGGCEIFPKQEEILVERGDVGNFINLPYFDHEMTTRYAFKEDGESATLEEFLELIDQRKVKPADFNKLQVGSKKTEPFPEGPPCLNVMALNGIGEGGRNSSLFNYATMFKKMDPDNWKNLLEKFNIEYCSNPLSASEIVTIQTQLEKKEYFYTCGQEPLKSHCNKSLCKRRKYGIGTTTDAVEITGLSVVKSEPRVFFADLDGRRLELTSYDLQSQAKFQIACLEQQNFMPPRVKEDAWQILINGLLSEANEIEVPEELTYKGQFLDLMESFCHGRVQAASAEELLLGKPWLMEDNVYFKIDSFVDFLKQKNFTHYSKGQIQERIKEINLGNKCNSVKAFKTTTGGWKSIRVWWVPDMKEHVEIPDVVIEEDVPF